MGRLWLGVFLMMGLMSSSGAHAQAAYDWRTDVVPTASGMVGATRDSTAVRLFAGRVPCQGAAHLRQHG